MAKSIQVEIKIEDFIFPNIGVGNFDGKRIEVKRALPGQSVEISVSKRKGRNKGRILNIKERAENEVKPLCPNTDKCGGCTFQTLTYDDEINLKHKMVKDLFINAGIMEIENAEIVGAPSVYGYRNKMEFSFGDEYKDGPLNLGLRNPGSYYEVCDGSLCNICDEDFNAITSLTKEFFDKKGARFYHRTSHNGQMRHLVVRKGKYTGDILINLVTSSDFNLDMGEYVSEVLKLNLEGKISGILHTINSSVADVVQADEMKLIYGKDYLSDKILGLDFKIYPFSFFQTNTAGAEKLYSTVREFCGNEKVGTLFDLYCGTGTIAQILSPMAEKVFGIEIVESAIKAAKENMAMNNITNCEFIAGDVLNEVKKLTASPDIIILDPPREGINPKAIDHIINFNAKKIIYVSCKPSSLVRDLESFIVAGYTVEKIRLHDMFPRSYHVETVVLLSKVEG